MQIDRILYPITSLGPGERLVIWTIGCSKRCYNCANPELWEKQPANDVDVNQLFELIKNAVKGKKIDGITITGGDPLEQIPELVKLLPLLHEITDDILVYTGYTVAEISDLLSGDGDTVATDSDWVTLKKYITVLIDGSYIDLQNDNQCVLRGSTNQNLIYFDESKKVIYEAYMEKGRTIQNVFHKDKMISVGIHNTSS